MLHSLLATFIKGYGNFTSEKSILSVYPVLRGPVSLRTFARKFSNIDFFLKILSLKDDELVMSEM